MSKSDAGKGDAPRPMFITRGEWSDNHDLAFRKKNRNGKDKTQKSKRKNVNMQREV